MVDDVKILRINELVSNIDEGQICFEPIADTDLGYKMMAMRHHDGFTAKLLSKGQPGLLTTLRLSGPTTTGTTGLLQHDLAGDITGGKMSVDVFNTYLTDGPVLTDAVESLNTLQGDVLLVNGNYIGVSVLAPNVTLTLQDMSSELESGGAWELDVTDLSGLLADPQNAGYIDSYVVDFTAAPVSGDVIQWDGTKFDVAQVSGGGEATTDHQDLTLSSRQNEVSHPWAFSTSGSRAMLAHINLSSFGFTDAFRSGSTWAFSGMDFSNSSSEWDSIKALAGGSETSLLGAIIAASDGGAYNNNQVVYGLNSARAQSPDLTFDEATGLLSGQPASRISAVPGSIESLYLGVHNDAYFNGLLYSYGDGIRLSFAAPIVLYQGATDQTILARPYTQQNNTTFFGLGDDNNLDIANFDHMPTDFQTPSTVDPRIRIHSGNNADITQYLDLSHARAAARIFSGNGPVKIGDANVNASTWTDNNGIALFADTTEWSAAYSALGNAVGSLWQLIQTTGGGSLDTAYRYGGSAPEAITVDIGAVTLTADNTVSSTSLLDIVSTDTTDQINNVVTIQNYNDLASCYAIAFGGPSTAAQQASKISYGNNGHLLRSLNQGVVCINERTDTNRASHAVAGSRSYGGNPNPYGNMAYLQATNINDGASPVSTVQVWHQAIVESSPTTGIDLTSDGDISVSTSNFRTSGETYDNADSASFSAGVLTIDWHTIYGPIVNIAVTADITAVSMTAPSGRHPHLIIRIANTDTVDHTITGFGSSVIWRRQYDPDETPQTIPAGYAVIIHLFAYDQGAYSGVFEYEDTINPAI